MAHRHIVSGEREEGYRGSVYGAEENQAAHGNIRCIELCACGAERHANINGRHIEQGPWGVCETAPAARTQKPCGHSNTTEEPANFDGVGAGLSGTRFITVCWDCGSAIGDAHRL